MKRLYKVKKFYKGGSNTFIVIITDKLFKDEFDSEQNLCEWLGEHTSGGDNYGYRITTQRIYKAPKKYKCYDIKIEMVNTTIMSTDRYKKHNTIAREMEEKKYKLRRKKLFNNHPV